MPLPLMNHSALALFAQRTRILTSVRSIGFCVSFGFLLVRVRVPSSRWELLFSARFSGRVEAWTSGLLRAVTTTIMATLACVCLPDKARLLVGSRSCFKFSACQFAF